jgi:pyrimidine deaminase RibD-like protein
MAAYACMLPSRSSSSRETVVVCVSVGCLLVAASSILKEGASKQVPSPSRPSCATAAAVAGVTAAAAEDTAAVAAEPAAAAGALM